MQLLPSATGRMDRPGVSKIITPGNRKKHGVKGHSSGGEEETCAGPSNGWDSTLRSGKKYKQEKQGAKNKKSRKHHTQRSTKRMSTNLGKI